ncbi:MAG: radical SAM protein [Chloroflexi bacterium]|nr:radical SAM protein [Chloroflexota bacterium]
MDRDSINEARERLSGEQGTIIKDWGGRIPFALVYPNSYYVGMSNLGVHAIYGFLNSYVAALCERVFWEKSNAETGQMPVSIESQRPLTDFAVLAFSISYELDYFNVARILKASGIPLYAADRDERYPLVIAGGPCITANPAPLSPFFDCFGIGEAETLLPSMLPLISKGLGGNRSDFLKSLAALPGIYVPHYSGTQVKRQWVHNLDDFPVGSTVFPPKDETELGDLYLMEVQRGCNWHCRFCLVSNAFCPMRYRSLDNLLTQAERGLRYHKRIGLVGPAVSDHPQINELLSGLSHMGAGISISSLRVKPILPVVLGELVRGGARTVVLAPEAGSQRLRRVLRKGISEADILEAVGKVSEQNIQQLKLYFMFGLPTETDEDVEEIIKLTLRCKDILDRKRRGCRLTLNIAPFVPKAGTPFQWLPMEHPDTLNRRLSLLKRGLMPKGIKIKSESPFWSEVQAVLARGDARTAKVLAAIEEISLAGWRRAVDACRLDSDYLAHQEWDIGGELPWDMLDLGTGPGFLEKEMKRALTTTRTDAQKE